MKERDREEVRAIVKEEMVYTYFNRYRYREASFQEVLTTILDHFGISLEYHRSTPEYITLRGRDNGLQGQEEGEKK